MEILVICDNEKMLASFMAIASQTDFAQYSFTYCTSSKKSMGNEGIKSIDIKKEYREKILGKYELVFSIHCRQLFPAELVRSVRCINVHPGYLPFNRGIYPQVFSIINKYPAGASIHEMDEEIDHGPVIVQKKIEVNTWDTSLDVYNKIVHTEITLLQEHLLSIIENEYEKKQLSGSGNLNSAKDFRNLCELDMKKEMRVEETIDLLRALTHPPYQNAFYTDKVTNKKVFVEIRLKTGDNE